MGSRSGGGYNDILPKQELNGQNFKRERLPSVCPQCELSLRAAYNRAFADS
jgi:hypothetical protein